MADPYRASREFERMIFGGVSEHPEPNAETHGHDHVSTRMTGRSSHGQGLHTPPAEDGTLIATITYNEVTGEVEYRRPPQTEPNA